MSWRDLYSAETLEAWDAATAYFQSIAEHGDCTRCSHNTGHSYDGVLNWCAKHETFTNLENTGMCLDSASDEMKVHNAILTAKNPNAPLAKYKAQREAANYIQEVLF